MNNMTQPLWLKKLLQVTTLTVGATFGLSTYADVSVEWLSPDDGSFYEIGESATLTGTAGKSGSIGTGLDLVLVLDSSGSMNNLRNTSGVRCYDLSISTCKRIRTWQREAAHTLIDSLPDGTAVGVVEFDSDAHITHILASIDTNMSTIKAAINGTDADGSTNIASGIDAAVSELVSRGHDDYTKQMIVFSDGVPTDTDYNRVPGTQNEATIAAMAAGVDAVHTVALPGASVAIMSEIAGLGNGTTIDATHDLSQLNDIFSGVGSSLVELESVVITLPDGEEITLDADAFGNFDLSDVIAMDINEFIATATGTDGSIATDTITLYGLISGNLGAAPSPDVNPVPVPASLPLFALALLGFAAIRRKMMRNK